MSTNVRPFPVDEASLGVFLSYSNKSFIADRIIPRVPVEGETFKWYQYNKPDLFIKTETKVGRTGQPNQVEFGATQESGFVEDHFIDSPVPYSDIQTAPPGFNPIANAMSLLAERHLIAREFRTATLLSTAANYPTDNKQTLSGSDQFSHADSDPVNLIMTELDDMLMRPNIAIINRPGWRALRNNTKLTAALAAPAYGNSSVSSAKGAPASLQAVADLFELQEIIVGEAWYNSAKEGQTPVMTRMWGNNLILLHQNPITSLKNGGITHSTTAAFGPPKAGQIFIPEMGAEGTYLCRAGEKVREMIVASDCGYLFSSVI